MTAATALPVVRIGLLGAARIAPAALLRPVRRVPEARVVAVAARDQRRAQALARRYGLGRVHPSYAALVADPEIDAVYNPLPNGLHAEWSLRALAAGKHVLCEKPLALNAAEAEQMATAATRSGLVLAEAFHYRSHPLAARLKAIVDSGELGRLRHLEAHLCVPLLRPGDIRYSYALGGGATMDLGCYTINLLRYLAGAEPVVVRARARLAAPQVDRFMAAELLFPDACTGRIVCSLFSVRLVCSRAWVHGEQGELRVTWPFHPHLYHRVVVRAGGKARVERVPGETTFTHQLRAFVAAVRGQSRMATDARDAVANLRVIDAVYAQAGLKPRGRP